MDNLEKNICNGYTVELAFENGIKRPFNLLWNGAKLDNENYVKFTSHVSNNSIISEYDIRWQLFNMSSIYFMLLKNNEIYGVVDVGVPTISTVFTLLERTNKNLLKIMPSNMQYIELIKKSGKSI